MFKLFGSCFNGYLFPNNIVTQTIVMRDSNSSFFTESRNYSVDNPISLERLENHLRSNYSNPNHILPLKSEDSLIDNYNFFITDTEGKTKY